MSSIARIRCAVEVPIRGELPGGTVERIRGAVAGPMPAALARRLGPVAATDPGSVWVLRRLRARVNVPATEPVTILAERIAAGMAAAVGTALRTGAGAELVRYPSRADHLAAFVAALVDGAGHVWAFDRFDGLRLLSPLAALRAGTADAACRRTDVVVALARTEALHRVLAAASGPDLVRTWSVCRDELRTVPVPIDRAAALLSRRVEGLAAALADEPVEMRALRLLGAAGIAKNVDGEVAGAVESVLGLVRTAARRRPGGTPAGRGMDRSAQPSEARDPERVHTGPRPAGRSLAGASAALFAALGAPVFLLVPSFAAVGAGRAELGGALRREVFAFALGVDSDDPAVTLAAGVDEAVGPEDGPEPALERTTRALVTALIDDGRIDLRRVAVERAGVGGGAVWIAREVTSDAWLACLPEADDDGQPPVDAVRALIEPAVGRPVEVVGPTGADVTADVEWLLGSAARAGLEAAGAAMAREGVRHLARRLMGFERSSLAYLNDRFLTPGGVVTDDGESILVELAAPPLQVVLTMAGLDGIGYRVPWLDRSVVVTHRDR